VLEHAVHAAAPTPLKKPTAQEKPVAVMTALATVCATLTVYVPAPPFVPETKAVTVVPATTPADVTGCPTARAPAETAVTMSDEPEIDAVKLTEIVPGGQKVPATGQGAPDDAPCAQNWPAGHGLSVADVLPVPTQ
jgi:hypothetical protein